MNLVPFVDPCERKHLIPTAHAVPTRNLARNRLTTCHREYTLDGRKIGRMIGSQPGADDSSSDRCGCGGDCTGIGRVDMSGERVEKLIVVDDHR